MKHNISPAIFYRACLFALTLSQCLFPQDALATEDPCSRELSKTLGGQEASLLEENSEEIIFNPIDLSNDLEVFGKRAPHGPLSPLHLSLSVAIKVIREEILQAKQKGRKKILVIVGEGNGFLSTHAKMVMFLLKELKDVLGIGSNMFLNKSKKLFEEQAKYPIHGRTYNSMYIAPVAQALGMKVIPANELIKEKDYII